LPAQLPECYQIVPYSKVGTRASRARISTRLISTGVGVGDASSNPTTALLLSVIQETFGRIATIVFAHRLGSALEPECKMYRLAADVFNDAAMILDCLSPAFPKVARVFLLSGSSVLRALCGVAAGSSKASLSAHFAKHGNLGEVNAVRLPIVAIRRGHLTSHRRIRARKPFYRCWACW
jgi:hypothetical protein